MPGLSILKTPTPYHIITALPRPQFAALQQKIFPIYFGIQTALPAVLALTYPRSLLLGTASGPSGTFAQVNRWSVLAPLTIMFLGGLVNMVFVGPVTVNIMKDRKHQETKDGKKSYDPPPHSKEMQELNKAFGRMHGISSLINLGSLLATICYGISFAERIQ
ncbi:hypothetical protein B7494_g5777 [Chlorociboria aeruginascens]|nr:hypothetical protein B7494_g5777 [Chlorociboria aeruginascens]